MKEIKDLIELVKTSLVKCPWCREQTIESYSEQLFSEAKELEEAIKSNDMKGVKGELGDILWNTIVLIHIAENKGVFSADDVVRHVNDKMRRRKPFLLSGIDVTKEEAMRIWNEEKTKEKQNGK